jgi:2-hydroxycyclohexanecarboxyl-CoA dehydrogenase
MGQAIARRFAAEGARVMVAGRNEAVLKALVDEIGGAYVCCDITVKADIDALVAVTIKRFGRVDVGINAVGLGLMKPFLDNTTEDLERITAVQFIGPFQFFQALIRAMTAGGSIIQISSATAQIMLDDHAAYMGTKAGSEQVIRAVANEFGARGIRANVISPGQTDTPMAAAAYAVPEIIKLFEREYPLGRTGTADDIANACLWVASDGCLMTGQVLQVNGGVTLRRNPRMAEIQAVAIAAGVGPIDVNSSAR